MVLRSLDKTAFIPFSQLENARNRDQEIRLLKIRKAKKKLFDLISQCFSDIL